MGAIEVLEIADVDEDVEDEPAVVNQAMIHYHRADGNYDEWGLHVWDGSADVIDWHTPLKPDGSDDFGIYFTVALAEDAPGLGYIIHKGDEKDLLNDQFLNFDMHGYEVWVDQNTPGYVAALTVTDGDEEE